MNANPNETIHMGDNDLQALREIQIDMQRILAKTWGTFTRTDIEKMRELALDLKSSVDDLWVMMRVEDGGQGVGR